MGDSSAISVRDSRNSALNLHSVAHTSGNSNFKTHVLTKSRSRSTFFLVLYYIKRKRFNFNKCIVLYMVHYIR